MRSNLLSSEQSEKLVATAKEKTGGALRSVIYFTRSDFDQLYLRDTLERDADLSSFVGHEWRGYCETPNAYNTSELGEYDFTARGFENGYLLRVATERKGVLITTDSLSLKDYESLAESLQSVLCESES